MKYWPLLLVLLFAFLIFSPVLNTYFSQDDWVFLSHVYKQPFLSVFKHYQETFYRPVGQQLFFWIGSRLFGLDAGGFHLLAILVHLINIILLWKLFRYFPAEQGPAPRDKILSNTKLLLLLFYAVNPAHFVALNWLTQIDIEIAVGFGLLTILFWKKTILSFIFFGLGLFSHETIVMLPAAMAVWVFKGPARQLRGRALLKPAMFFCFGILVLVVKFLANPFSPNADYTVSTNISGIISTLKWYGLRALFIPEGIRNLPVWLAVASLVPAVFLILTFRQKLIKGIGFYFLGILPVLGLGSHLLAAYAIFGIALMVIELGKSTVVSRAATVLGSAILLLAATGFVYLSYPNHWSTTRGIISQKLTEEYLGSGPERRLGILEQANNYKDNPEIYFSSMMGRQFKVLDSGAGRGAIDVLFYRGNDMTTQFLPDALFFKNSFLAGKFPIWNPWIMAGMPYLLDPQNFLWYPPNYLLLLTPLEVGFFILLIGHLAFAGLFVRKVSDTLQKNRLIGWLGAAMFVFSPKLIGNIEEGNWSLVIAACWLPFLYWSLINKRFNWAAISLSAIIINNLNIGYYSILFTVIYYLVVMKRTVLDNSRTVLKTFVLAILFTIPRWLPLALFGNQTVRENLQEAPLPFWSWAKILKSLFFPLAGSHPVLQNEEILYVGIIPIILIIAYVLFKGPALRQQQGRALFWTVWLTFISMVAVNLKTPFFYLIKFLPGFSLLRITTRPWIFVALALAVGVPRMIEKIGEIRDIWGIRVSRRFTNFVIAVLSGLIMIEFGLFDWTIFSRREIVPDHVPMSFYQQIAGEGTQVRAYCTTGCLDRLTAQKMGIAILGGNNPVQLKEFVNYLQKAGRYMETGYFPILPPYTVFNQQPQPDAELMAQTNTKFVVSSYKLTDENFELIDQQENFKLYRNKLEATEMKNPYVDWQRYSVSILQL